MRVAHLEKLFSTAVVSAALFRGSPCGNPCNDVPAGTSTYDITPVDAGADAEAGADAGAPPSPGTPTLVECQKLCGDPPDRTYAPQVTACTVEQTDAGRLQVHCDETAYQACSGGGRRTAGVTDGAFEAPSARAAFFAYSAVLEASSVLSFRRLRAELRAHGAPRRLLRAMSRAARDESRHARSMGSFARRHGARVGPPKAAALVKRGLLELCLENAVEGCVVETYSALLARWQAERAQDPEVRSAMRRIAHEETRHAALAWELAKWAEARLDRDGRARVQQARSEAFAALAPRVRRNASPELVEAGLVPGAREGAHLVAVLAGALAA